MKAKLGVIRQIIVQILSILIFAGLKLQMLEPTVPLNDGTNRIALPDYLNVEDDLRCSTEVTSKVFRNFQQYDDYRKSSAQFASSESESSTEGVFFWTSKV